MIVEWLAHVKADRACIITAWNPFSAPTLDAENEHQQERLKAQIEAAMLRWLPSQGRDPSGEWPPEASLCVLDPTVPQIDEWLREYRQFAAVTLCPRTGCQLRWHPEVLV
ncbi:DUF3293 domain-containing protein [Mitsuaria sp. WAJ17]|uniref:DUF3293 domain-containing protein n=1 Tax=Mitsuaria sp. WAJ17 TaxID=2761452 RepID=UPI001601FDB6|nr:DUF3293 domain-containing protein [Mitsuaria sp. WAJ17]MBB2485035.1 DUF3293 domain-containing protein [Mitsuaria sp. WAJ17]